MSMILVFLAKLNHSKEEEKMQFVLPLFSEKNLSQLSVFSITYSQIILHYFNVERNEGQLIHISNISV